MNQHEHSICAATLQAVILGGTTVLAGQGAWLHLDAELTKRAGREQLAMTAAEPGPAGALQVALPEALGDLAQGTVMFRLRSPRRIAHAPEKPRRMDLLCCPGLRVELTEANDSLRFTFYPPDGATRPAAVCLIAYLLPDQWHHVALSWNSKTGLVDLFVNGWAQQRTNLPAWEPAGERVLRVGGALGQGEDATRIDIQDVSLHAWTMNEAQLRRAVPHEQFADGGSGIRQRFETGLDLGEYTLEPVFQADFSQPLPIIAEDTLFEGDQRVREPAPGEWVLEGPAKAFSEGGKLTIDNLAQEGAAHVVLWLPRAFPQNVLLEFDITIEREDEGLAIVFLAARPVNDPLGSIFKLDMAKRAGVFTNYTRGDVNSYHVSYLAAGQRQTAIPGPRRVANVRKNSGFWLVACGDDQILGHGLGRGPHRVRFLKYENRIRVEANGKLSVAFDDDGQTWGPVWGDGYIGLRQMNHLYSAQYENLRVYEVRR